MKTEKGFAVPHTKPRYKGLTEAMCKTGKRYEEQIEYRWPLLSAVLTFHGLLIVDKIRYQRIDFSLGLSRHLESVVLNHGVASFYYKFIFYIG